ncbi:MAG: hypothetical protein GY793_09085 [Proteobacteria bacterium]|nr:hypothetical protein [Pseudomonadota bacterium]
MSIVLVNNFAVGDVNLTAMMKTLNLAYKGKSNITLSNYDNDTAPDVKVGSVFDCNGSIFEVTSSDETPSGYSGIANDTMFYLIYSAGLNEFIYTATAPTWSDSKQGWYDGNNRYFFSMFKGTTTYEGKLNIQPIQHRGDVKKFVKRLGLTDGEWFNILESWVPVVGQFMSVCGQFNGTGTLLKNGVVRQITRETEDRVVLYFAFNENSEGATQYVNINRNSSATNYVGISLISFFDPIQSGF